MPRGVNLKKNAAKNFEKFSKIIYNKDILGDMG